MCCHLLQNPPQRDSIKTCLNWRVKCFKRFARDHIHFPNRVFSLTDNLGSLRTFKIVSFKKCRLLDYRKGKLFTGVVQVKALRAGCASSVVMRCPADAWNRQPWTHLWYGLGAYSQGCFASLFFDIIVKGSCVKVTYHVVFWCRTSPRRYFTTKSISKDEPWKCFSYFHDFQ